MLNYEGKFGSPLLGTGTKARFSEWASNIALKLHDYSRLHTASA
jgi:hypothetical protein